MDSSCAIHLADFCRSFAVQQIVADSIGDEFNLDYKAVFNFNPLSPSGDQHLISPYNVTA